MDPFLMLDYFKVRLPAGFPGKIYEILYEVELL